MITGIDSAFYIYSMIQATQVSAKEKDKPSPGGPSEQKHSTNTRQSSGALSNLGNGNLP